MCFLGPSKGDYFIGHLCVILLMQGILVLFCLTPQKHTCRLLTSYKIKQYSAIAMLNPESSENLY